MSNVEKTNFLKVIRDVQVLNGLDIHRMSPDMLDLRNVYLKKKKKMTKLKKKKKKKKKKGYVTNFLVYIKFSERGKKQKPSII
jgi:hypothetical protein